MKERVAIGKARRRGWVGRSFRVGRPPLKQPRTLPLPRLIPHRRRQWSTIANGSSNHNILPVLMTPVSLHQKAPSHPRGAEILYPQMSPHPGPLPAVPATSVAAPLTLPPTEFCSLLLTRASTTIPPLIRRMPIQGKRLKFYPTGLIPKADPCRLGIGTSANIIDGAWTGGFMTDTEILSIGPNVRGIGP